MAFLLISLSPLEETMAINQTLGSKSALILFSIFAVPTWAQVTQGPLSPSFRVNRPQPPNFSFAPAPAPAPGPESAPTPSPTPGAQAPEPAPSPSQTSEPGHFDSHGPTTETGKQESQSSL